MKKYRIIKNVKTGCYIVQEKCLWWWFDVSLLCNHISQAEKIKKDLEFIDHNSDKKNWEVVKNENKSFY